MPHSPQKINLLYVEDDASTRSLVEHFLLNNQQYNVLTGFNGRHGLQLFSENQVDIVLTDIMMPKLNGLEMARTMREISKECQIVVMTAFSDTSFLLDAIDIGVNQFVLKPVEFKKLGIALDRCSNIVQMRRQLKNQEAEVLRAKKMEAIGILAGGMAHDFNNMLQVILGYISMALTKSEPGSKIHEMLTIVEQSSGEAQRLSQRLLSLSRGNLCVISKRDIRTILKECLDIVRQRHGFTIEYREQENILEANLDSERIYQLFNNILTNACESMKDGGVISVSLSQEYVSEYAGVSLKPGTYLHVSIQDFGSGIAPELLPDVFDPYVTTKEMGTNKGAGLGLTLCHAIVKKHNGAIFIESTLGEGTTVHVYLPVASTED